MRVVVIHGSPDPGRLSGRIQLLADATRLLGPMQPLLPLLWEGDQA